MLSRATVLTIQHTDNRIVVDSSGPSLNKKYYGWISLQNNDRFRVLISTPAIFNSERQAKQQMANYVSHIRGLQLHDTNSEQISLNFNNIISQDVSKFNF